MTPFPDPADAAALATVRHAYAKQMLALAGVTDDPALEAAFASVPRERFLGPPPWRMVRPRVGYVLLDEPDPVLAYADVLFALAHERGVNNGSPSLHAAWLHAAGIVRGARVAHVGAGTGYYTAIIAALIGDTGRVTAVEFDPDLAARAKENVSHLPQVEVIAGDGAGWPRDATDLTYVNFAVERPAPAWLDHLVPGGRLIFPLGVASPSDARDGRHATHGAGLLIERRGGDSFAARWLGPAFFVGAEGSAADAAEDMTARLRAAFERGGVEFVRSLRRGSPAAPGRCWFTGPDWSLCYDEPA